MKMSHPLAVYRKAKGLTQRELADVLNVARETVARWEGGRRIDTEFLTSIAKKTGIATAELRPDLANLLKAAE